MKKLPLNSVHEALGARMVEFAGFWMPVQYSSILEEHKAVRSSVGLFDVSHMGEFRVLGKGAQDFLQKLISNDLKKIKPGKAQYNILMNEQGGAVDDIIIYKFSEEEFFICVNAANIEKDYGWFMKFKPEGVELKDLSNELGLFALQGRNAKDVLSRIFPSIKDELKRFSFGNRTYNNQEVLIARTGYTGEDGFEVFHPVGISESLWFSIIDAGKDFDIRPCGLGARDTLRLEAGLPLYGHELKDDISPLEAGLERFVDLEKGDFLGRMVLEEQKKNGVKRIRAGVVLDEGIPRDGYKIYRKGKQIGYITSGTFSPMLEKGIALALIEPAENVIGNEIEVEVRGKVRAGKIAQVPFIKN